jgi:capsular polysaccharide transport system permease protein
MDVNKTEITNKRFSFFTKKHIKTVLQLRNKAFYIVVILPWLILAIYYVMFASPRYESAAIVTLKQNETSAIPDSSLGLLSGISTQSSSNDYLLINYINSLGMLYLLNEQLHIKKLYQNNDIDFISRLSTTANQQEFLDYYQNMISAIYDPEASMITIKAEGYTPTEAKTILIKIIENSQKAVDYISHTLAKQRMKFSEVQMDLARKKALIAQSKLLEFQDKHGLVDPEGSVMAYSSIISTMQAELATTESQLTALLSYLNENSQEVTAAKQKILALQKQIDKEKAKLVTNSAKNTIQNSKSHLNELTSNYTWIKLNAEFSMSEYTAAMQSFEIAKIDSLKQQSYLVTVVQPNLPDEPAYPRIWYNLLTLLIILLALYGIGRMIITIILEHR